MCREREGERGKHIHTENENWKETHLTREIETREIGREERDRDRERQRQKEMLCWKRNESFNS